MKAFFWILGITVLILIIGFSSKNSLRELLFKDQFIVRPRGVELNRIKIKQTAEGSTDTLTVYNGERRETATFRKMGLNIFLVYKDNKLITTFEQFKQTEWATHQYLFEINVQRDSTTVDLHISGPDQSL
ncbi:MAG TPA: hypothetical protein PKL31_00075 [Fulvivirga sp.]|nr:hypothetical protein [Fulvivirga sp.]